MDADVLDSGPNTKNLLDQAVIDESVLDDCVILEEEVDEDALLGEISIEKKEETRKLDSEGRLSPEENKPIDSWKDEEEEHLAIESFFGSEDSSADHKIEQDGILRQVEDDNKLIEEGTRATSDQDAVNEVLSRIVDKIVDGDSVNFDNPLLLDAEISNTVNEDDEMDIIFLDEVVGESSSQKTSVINTENETSNLVKEELAGVAEFLGLTRPELRRYINKRLDTYCTNEACLSERRLLKEQQAKNAATITLLKTKLVETLQNTKNTNLKYKQLTEAHLHMKKMIVALRNEISTLKADQKIQLTRAGGTSVNVTIPSTHPIRGIAIPGPSQKGTIIAGTRPNISIPSAAQKATQNGTSPYGSLSNSSHAPSPKRPRIMETNGISSSQVGRALNELNNRLKSDNASSNGSARSAIPVDLNGEYSVHGLQMQRPLEKLFGRQIIRSNRMNVDIGVITGASDLPPQMQTLVLPKVISGHRLPAVTTKSSFSPKVTVTTTIENLIISKKLHSTVVYQLPTSTADSDCALGIFYYLRSELRVNSPPNWKIGALVYPAEGGKSKLCFDFSQDPTLPAQGVLAIAVLFTPIGHFASEAFRYDIPDQRMLAMAARDRTT